VIKGVSDLYCVFRTGSSRSEFSYPLGEDR
jgi:hypothetical protein